MTYTVDGATVEKIEFTNKYEATGKTQFEGTKELNGRGLKADEFTFELYDGEGNLIESVQNDADGKFVFSELEYLLNETQNDVGTYTYTVKEKKESLTGVTYDETEYTITVTVTDNGDGTLNVDVSGAEAIKFTNTYKPPHDDTPGTGDNSQIKLWSAMTLASAAGLSCMAWLAFRKKKREEQ